MRARRLRQIDTNRRSAIVDPEAIRSRYVPPSAPLNGAGLVFARAGERQRPGRRVFHPSVTAPGNRSRSKYCRDVAAREEDATDLVGWQAAHTVVLSPLSIWSPPQDAAHRRRPYSPIRRTGDARDLTRAGN